jgi:hypothetical protein
MTIPAPARTRAISAAKSLAASASEMWITSWPSDNFTPPLPCIDENPKCSSVAVCAAKPVDFGRGMAADSDEKSFERHPFSDTYSGEGIALAQMVVQTVTSSLQMC